MKVDTHFILNKQKIGLWTIELEEGKLPRLFADDVMAELMGMPNDLSPEDAYNAWAVGTNEESARIMADATQKMLVGEYAEAQYSWKHPDGTMRLVRCGGSRDFDSTGFIRLVGSHRDVTGLIHYDMAQAIRDKNIIKRYLESAKNAITVDMDRDTFVELKYDPDSILEDLPENCSFSELAHQFINEFVAPQSVRNLMELANPTNLKQRLEVNDHIKVKYLKRIGKVYRWYCLEARKLSASEAFVISRDIDNRELEGMFWEAVSTQMICGFIIDANTQVVTVTKRNPIYTDFYDYKYTTLDRLVEISGSVMDDGYLDEWKKICKIDKLRVLLRENRVAEYTFTTHQTGELMWVHAYLFPIKTKEGANAIAMSFIQFSQEALEQRKRDEEYRKALEEVRFAQEANRLKTQFVMNVSHDIRTPLHAIVGFSQLLAQPDIYIDEEEKQKYSTYIKDNADLLTIIINDVLSMSDMERGNLNINKAPVSCNEICNKSVNCSAMRTPAGVNMYYTSDVDDSFTIISDVMRVQQILVNFLSNACKHTSEGEIRVHCSLRENPGMVTFSVADTGEGVDPSIADDIFERFKTFDNDMDGHGMGLHICSDLAERLGGRVALDRYYRNGARFILALPLA